jgi:hypothetical protein
VKLNGGFGVVDIRSSIVHWLPDGLIEMTASSVHVYEAPTV